MSYVEKAAVHNLSAWDLLFKSDLKLLYNQYWTVFFSLWLAELNIYYDLLGHIEIHIWHQYVR